MADRSIAETLVATLAEDGIPGKRPVHAWGIGATGTFQPSEVARSYCIAAHFQERFRPDAPETPDPVRVTVRFSNGSGSKRNKGDLGPHDGWSDVRGMAARFHLADGTATDLIAMTLPCFFTRTPEEFLLFAEKAVPAPFTREKPWRKFLDMVNLTLPLRDPYPGEEYRPDEGAMAFADASAEARLAVFQAASIGAPVSYARATYHAVHTFVVTAPDGTRRWVRFTWQPVGGALNVDPNRPPPPDPYLQQELRDRLAEGPARFSLMMMIGETGDDFNNSTLPWPPHRVRVMMGTLTLDKVIDCEDLSFNPGLLTPGIEASDDPVLWVRKEAYEISSTWRGGVPCPFSGG